MIIDLDAHQGNGHEKDFSADSMRSILTFFICSSRALFITVARAVGSLLYDFLFVCFVQEESIFLICTIQIYIHW